MFVCLYVCSGSGFATKGMIGVTQPRRVAAITVAQRVAQEHGQGNPNSTNNNTNNSYICMYIITYCHKPLILYLY